MINKFQFTKDQKEVIVQILRTETGLSHLEDIVNDYINDSKSKTPTSELRHHLKEVKKYSTALKRSIEALSKGHSASNEWILDPVIECEQYAAALLKYRFSRNLRRGRPPHIAEIHLVQQTALAWEQITGKKPGRGRGPFSNLISYLFSFSEIEGAPTEYPEELVQEALPASVSVKMLSKDYPFSPLDPDVLLPPLKAAAEKFFTKVLWLADGRLIAFTVASKNGGENR